MQKWLLSEYSNFQDIVLIESPFAEISREGKGTHQIYIWGLKIFRTFRVWSLVETSVTASWNFLYYLEYKLCDFKPTI